MPKSCSLFLLLFLTACQQDEADKPKVETMSVTAVGLNKALLQGELVEVGPIKPVQYGFFWSTRAGVHAVSAEGNVLVGESYEGEISFAHELVNLPPDTEFFVRAFAATNGYTSFYYGDEVSFRTSQPANYLRTLPAQNITVSSAELKGELVNLNELTSVRYGFVWSTAAVTSLLDGNVIIVGTSTRPTSYLATLNALQANETYYYRAFLSNESGTLVIYGDQFSFTTN